MVLHVYFFMLIVLGIESPAKPEVLETTTPNWGERIINGKPTTIEQHPYQAFLEISSSICSGSIISETVILTAAHCLEKATPQDVTAHVGITYANQIKYDAGYDSNKIAIHPSYDRATHDYDFGLIWVDKINIDGITTKIINVADSSYNLKPESNITVAGWGIVKCLHPGFKCTLGSRANRLQDVDLPVIEWGRCKNAYDTHAFHKWPVTRRMWCAGYLESGRDDSHRERQDACVGDSGAGAVQGDTLVGVVSWAYECGRGDSPGVYADVRRIDWIAEQLRIPYQFIKSKKLDPMEVLISFMLDFFVTIFTTILIYVST